MVQKEKTDLQREILLAWYENPNATNKEIATACDCSSSYVSTVKNRFNNYNEFEAMMDRQDKEMEQMFGDDIFMGGSSSLNTTTNQKGIAEQFEEIPNNAVGLIFKGMILLIMAYAAFEVVNIILL
jgi:hypothetical protein